MAGDFKSYVLGFLFYRFISENLTGYLNEQERRAGNPDFDYAKLSDHDAEFGRTETVKEKGFYILPSELFANVRARARQDANLNEILERVFKNIEGSATGTESEDDIKGLFDDLDVNSNKLGPTVAKRNEKLVKLLDAIGDLPLSNGGDFSQNSIDLFGDAYEYLMQMYASTAGKSGGEFYTPQEVSELLARITVVGKTEVNKVYDPACDSSSLLLKFVKACHSARSVAESQNPRGAGMDPATARRVTATTRRVTATTRRVTATTRRVTATARRVTATARRVTAASYLNPEYRDLR